MSKVEKTHYIEKKTMIEMHKIKTIIF